VTPSSGIAQHARRIATLVAVSPAAAPRCDAIAVAHRR
jgi:hypothetical protein